MNVNIEHKHKNLFKTSHADASFIQSEDFKNLWMFSFYGSN